MRRTLFWLWLTLREITGETVFSPASTADWAPRKLGTRANRSTSGCFSSRVWAIWVASCIWGIALGLTKLVHWSFFTPEARIASMISSLVSVGIIMQLML